MLSPEDKPQAQPKHIADPWQEMYATLALEERWASAGSRPACRRLTAGLAFCYNKVYQQGKFFAEIGSSPNKQNQLFAGNCCKSRIFTWRLKSPIPKEFRGVRIENNRKFSTAHPNCHHLNVRHFFDGEAQPLPAQAALAIAAIRHVIGAKVRRVVDNDAAKIQTLNRF